MEPEKSKSLTPDPGDSFPDPKKGDELGNDGLKLEGFTMIAAAEKADNLHEGEGMDVGGMQQSSAPDGEKDIDVTNVAVKGKDASTTRSNGGVVSDGPITLEVSASTDSATDGRRDALPTKNTANVEAPITKPRTTTSPEKNVVASGASAALPVSLQVKQAPNEGTPESTATAWTEGPTGGRILTERKGAENSRDRVVGGAAAGECSLSPTPPRTRSNPLSRGTPPQRGSRGGNLVICTQQSFSSPGDEDGRDWPMPTSPRSRPRDQPLVRAKNGGGGVDGGNGSGDDEDDAVGEVKDKVTSFSSRRWKASDEYVLDEDR